MDVTIACICPPMTDGAARHPDGDVITFRERMSFHDALALQKDMALASDDDTTTGDSLAVLTEGYLLRGIESWTVVDERGRAVEATRVEIRDRLLTNFDVAMDVSNAADELYGAQVLLPLVRRAERSSSIGPTESSTSRPTASPKRPPRPSKQSSTSTTPTAATGTITSLPAGDSKSSPNATSAA